MYYDLAKLNGGMIISYKDIKHDLFSYKEISNHNVIVEYSPAEDLMDARRVYEEFLKEKGFRKEKISIITGLIFLNMAPMHNFPFDRFIYNFGKLFLYNALEMSDTKF